MTFGSKKGVSKSDAGQKIIHLWSKKASLFLGIRWSVPDFIFSVKIKIENVSWYSDLLLVGFSKHIGTALPCVGIGH